MQNIGIGEFIDENKAFISERHFSTLKKHRCIPGDVIVGMLGDPNLRAVIVPEWLPQALNKADCAQIRVDPEYAANFYVCWLLNVPSTLHLVNGLLHGQTRTRIGMSQLSSVVVPVPDLVLQQKFTRIVTTYERLRAQQREALREAEHLFQTLLHGAFPGEG